MVDRTDPVQRLRREIPPKGGRTHSPRRPVIVIAIDGKPTSAQTRADLASGTVPLGFSRGKDSLAAWLALRDADVNVVPFHLYRVPGLEFIEESPAAYEEFFGQRIIQLPHPSLFRLLNNLVFQTPERFRVVAAADLPEPSYEDMAEWLREDLELPDAWCVDGVRAADSPNRRMAFVTHGPLRDHLRKASVVWDWQKREVMDCIAAHGARLPREYEWFGRSFDGLDYRFLKPLSEHAPADYARILEWFPLADLEIFRREVVNARAAA